ncbi:MAG: ATP-binding cassette domain-containing protein [Desulfobacterales bacterium]|nr:ATP-binding cassette domain-containing protein [Desulfobacterales bacterium]
MTAAKRMPPPVVSLEGVTARIRDRRILPGTSWTIRAGQSWAVVGPNGAGKSTLAGLLIGTVPAVSGKVIRHGSEARPERIGHVSFELLERLAAREARLDAARQFSRQTGGVTLARELLFSPSVKPPAEDRRLPKAARRLGVHRLLDRDITALSSGEMRRLLIARALADRPKIVVLDEPFEGLDAASSRVLKESISEMIREGRIVVLVTHLLANVVPEISHALCVQDGRVVRQGLRRKVLTERFLHRLYAGRPTLLAPAPPAFSPERETPADPAEPPLVVMKNVCVAYGASPVVKSVSWTIQPGEHWALLGPNGAGKTTLLSMIAGDHPQAYANEIYLFGRRRGTGESIWEIKRRISLISPELQLRYRKPVSVMTAVLSGFTDSVGFYRQASDKEIAEAGRWLAFVGLGHRAEDRLDRLSYGERRRVLLARCMVKSPDLLILDEPCQGLDPQMRKRFLTLIDRIGRRKRPSILYVTHQSDEVPSCVRQVIRLESTPGPPFLEADSGARLASAKSCKTCADGR